MTRDPLDPYEADEPWPRDMPTAQEIYDDNREWLAFMRKRAVEAYGTGSGWPDRPPRRGRWTT